MKYLGLILLSFLLVILSAEMTVAQSNKKISYQANDIFVDKIGTERVRKLIGNVVFKQESTTVYCDSSYFYRTENIMKAYSNVRIVDEATVITSKRLIYEGDGRMARLRDNVIYNNQKNRLFTDVLDYHMDDETASYWEGGKLVDSTNTLTSVSGIFNSKQEYANFYKNVVLIAPEYTLKTDTLRYNTTTKIAITTGYTEIINKDGTQLFSQGGIFRTEIDQSDFVEGAVETEEYIMVGDNLYFDELRKYYRGQGNVVLTAKEKDVIIVGDDGYYDQENGFAKIYGNAIMKKLIQEDTFYMAADTLLLIEGEFDSLTKIHAYPDIRFFKTNMQGLADSATYFIADSTLRMYGDPIVWNEKSQITADTIAIEVTDKNIKKMYLMRNAFMISKDTLDNFNQIKGRFIETFFKNNNMDFLLVDGNAESIFYSLEKGDSSLMGMNSVICGNMRIGFVDNKISSITAYSDVEGRFIPPHELTSEVERLAGFNWKEEIRPTLQDIFIKNNKKRNSIPTSNEVSRPKPELRNSPEMSKQKTKMGNSPRN